MISIKNNSIIIIISLILLLIVGGYFFIETKKIKMKMTEMENKNVANLKNTLIELDNISNRISNLEVNILNTIDQSNVKLNVSDNDVVTNTINDTSVDEIVNDIPVDEVNDIPVDEVNDTSVNEIVNDIVNDTIEDVVTDTVNDTIEDVVTDTVNDHIVSNISIEEVNSDEEHINLHDINLSDSDNESNHSYNNEIKSVNLGENGPSIDISDIEVNKDDSIKSIKTGTLDENNIETKSTNEGDYINYSAKDLRKLLLKYNLPLSGNKQKLISRIINYYKENN